MEIFIARGEDRNGPYSEDAIRQFLADGKFDGTELAWHEGLDGWVNVKELVEGATSADTPETGELQKPKVFIFYRRDDCQGTADFLYSLLEDHFGSENVFFDVDSLHPGRNWRRDLDEEVSQCDVFLALIGKRWITVENKTGEKRLFDEGDPVRKEIISAMDQDKTVIPLLVERADMPTVDQLPEALTKFCDQQATDVRPGSDFKKDVAKLIKDLEHIEPAKDTPSLDEQIIEGVIRYDLNKYTGQLTNEDLGKVENLHLANKQIPDLSALLDLPQLTTL